MLGWEQSQLVVRSQSNATIFYSHFLSVDLIPCNIYIFMSKFGIKSFKSKTKVCQILNYLKYILIIGLQELCDAYYLSRREYYFDRWWFDPPFNTSECEYYTYFLIIAALKKHNCPYT